MLTERSVSKLAEAILKGHCKITSKEDAYKFALQIMVVLEQAVRDEWGLYRSNPGATRYLPLPGRNTLNEIIEAYSEGAEVGALPLGKREVLVFRPLGWPE